MKLLLHTYGFAAETCHPSCKHVDLLLGTSSVGAGDGVEVGARDGVPVFGEKVGVADGLNVA